jgi:hypothetical protein
MKCMAFVVSLLDVEQVMVTFLNSFTIAYTFLCAREPDLFVDSCRNRKHEAVFNKHSLQPIFLLILDCYWHPVWPVLVI